MPHAARLRVTECPLQTLPTKLAVYLVDFLSTESTHFPQGTKVDSTEARRLRRITPGRVLPLQLGWLISPLCLDPTATWARITPFLKICVPRACNYGQ